MVPANPATKAVPRASLYTLSPLSTSPEPDLEEQLHAQLARLYSPSIPPLTTPTTTTTSPNAPHHASSPPPSKTTHDPSPPDEAQTYEFRLFSTPTTHSTAPPPQRIVIRSPTPSPKDAVGGFVVPHRPRQYYFSDDDAVAGRKRKRRREFEEVGVTGENVLRRSRVERPGCALPWRVLTIHLPPRHRRSLPSSTSSSSPLVPDHARRKRPGKKRRLALHKAMAASKAFAATREMSAREREVAEREKRTRRNREKKVKRKLKGKEAKEKKNGEEEGAGEGG